MYVLADPCPERRLADEGCLRQSRGGSEIGDGCGARGVGEWPQARRGPVVRSRMPARRSRSDAPPPVVCENRVTRVTKAVWRTSSRLGKRRSSRSTADTTRAPSIGSVESSAVGRKPVRDGRSRRRGRTGTTRSAAGPVRARGPANPRVFVDLAPRRREARASRRARLGWRGVMATGPLRGVVRVVDAGVNWRAVLACGHEISRPKRVGSLNVLVRCRCEACGRAAQATPAVD